MKTRWHKFKFWLGMRLVALGKRWAEEAMFPDDPERLQRAERDNMVRRQWPR